MLRFTDIIQGRHSAFEPKFSHFVITLIVFVATYYITMEYRYQLPWFVSLFLLLAICVSTIGLVVSFGSLRHSTMIVVQGLALGFIASTFHPDWMMKIAYGVGTFLVVYFIIKKLCTRFLKFRNMWETTTGIVALCGIYPYAYRVVLMLVY